MQDEVCGTECPASARGWPKALSGTWKTDLNFMMVNSTRLDKNSAKSYFTAPDEEIGVTVKRIIDMPVLFFTEILDTVFKPH